MKPSHQIDELNNVENPARELLERLGWTYLPREILAAERGDEREVLLKGRLTRALLRLNEWISEEQAGRVVFELENLDATGMARNQAVHEYLTYGMPLSVEEPGGRRTRIARFFDFENPERGLNEFVVTTQFRVRRFSGGTGNDLDDEKRSVVPDLVLFINGIPLVVMEAKSPTLLRWRSQAIQQLRRYQEAEPKWHDSGAPRLFDYNLLCVAHCGAGAVYAGLAAPESAYFAWKSVLPYSEDEVAQRFGFEPQSQARLIVGLLAPATLLDILRDYVVYEPEQGKLVKKLPRYQQYRAVRAALDRIVQGNRPEERGGVVWHTQGSGKSLTMLWMATKLRREPRLGSWTIVVVTDRTQLDSQISETFRRCGFPAPEQASTIRDLRRLLTTGVGRTVMTTIQKFADALEAPEGELDVLNASENVLVMADEAHRSQYGTLGAVMSKALPNATLIGFTGTPIDKQDRSTMGRFGSLIDSYTIPESVADGAAVPIYYEARLPELAIEGPATLDKLFDAMFGDEPEELQARIRRRFANKETVAEADRRIEMIALDIAEHFEAKVRPNGFKAQVVAPSRRAALRYAAHLNAFGISAYPIITTAPGDGPEFAAARDLNQAQIVGAFVDPEGEPEILVVVDMLLTGFDAPAEQVLYLDRALQEHGLLQAIARVNRRFGHRKDGVETEKRNGLVIDYHGVSRDLEAALSSFDWPDVQESMRELDEDPGPAIESAAVQAESHFKGRDLGDTWACVSVFVPDGSTEDDFKVDLYERFNRDYREFSRLMDRYLPDPGALDYVPRLAHLTEIRAYVRAQFLREDAHLNWTEIGAKVKDLVDKRIDAQVRTLMEPLSILDQDFDQKIAALPHDEARASLMEHAIRAQIHARIGENPIFAERLSVQLARIIQELQQRVIDAAEACQRLFELRDTIQSEADIAAAHGLSPMSFSIYELLDSSADSSDTSPAVDDGDTAYRTHFDETTKTMALKLEETVDKHRAVVEWQSNLEVQRMMRRDIKRELRGAGTLTEERLDEFAHRIVSMARERSAP